MEEKDESVSCLQQEKEELVSKYEAEKRELMEEILTLQQRRDESLLMLENEKQKVRGNSSKVIQDRRKLSSPSLLRYYLLRTLHTGIYSELSEHGLSKFSILGNIQKGKEGYFHQNIFWKR